MVNVALKGKFFIDAGSETTLNRFVIRLYTTIEKGLILLFV